MIEDWSCVHGGAFFDAVGDEFDDLTRRTRIVNADVLDAWFPPSPRVLDALQTHLPWLLSTSPPTDCGGMARVVARARGVPEDCVLPGAGSSALIYLAFTRWLSADSHVVLLDPTYGEYRHVLQRMVGCQITRLMLAREDEYRFDPARLIDAAREKPDLIVLVNPSSPTGQHIRREELTETLRSLPSETRIWIDETYVDYVDSDESLEHFATTRANVVVCKSMSKVYALSGARAAYLCSNPRELDTLRKFVPPWAVSLPAQVAAVAAIQDPGYYAQRYDETRELREVLISEVGALPGIEPLRGVANFVLCHLDPRGPTAATVVDSCREHGVFLRDVSSMGTALGSHVLRIAVKDADGIHRIVAALRQATT